MKTELIKLMSPTGFTGYSIETSMPDDVLNLDITFTLIDTKTGEVSTRTKTILVPYSELVSATGSTEGFTRYPITKVTFEGQATKSLERLKYELLNVQAKLVVKVKEGKYEEAAILRDKAKSIQKQIESMKNDLDKSNE